MVQEINGPHLLNLWMAKASTVLVPSAGSGLFDKLIIEERETWTAELWRPYSNVGFKDFGGSVSIRMISL